MFEDDFAPAAELGGLQPPRQYSSAAPPKVRKRDKQRDDRSKLGELSAQEALQLEAQLGVAAEALPRHLRAYALQRRNDACFSGPGLLPGEQEAGNIEYKLRLLDPTPARFQQLATQLNWRLSEGCGECLYALGVEDNGHPRGLEPAELEASLRVLWSMADEVGAAAEVLQASKELAAGGRDRRGGVDSGKSTLVGVLCHGAGGGPALDSGRGSARAPVLRHKHELESGHTSSISVQQCAYDAQGAVLNYSGLAGVSAAELAGSAARMARFFDLGGHERFSKTMLHGLTALLPDLVLLCVSAVAGVSWVTREHLAVALALGIPLAVAINKSDLAGEAEVARVVDEIRDLLAAAVQQGGGAVPSREQLAPLVQSAEQAAQLAGAMHRSRVGAPGASLCVPLFATSSVTGAGLQVLHSFLHLLPPTSGDCSSGGSGGGDGGASAAPEEGMQGWCRAAAGAAVAAAGGSQSGGPAHFQIDASFEVAEVGTVYSGTVVSGRVAVGDELLLGPLEVGSFRRVAITGIHRSKVDVAEVQQGQHATLAVRQLDGGGAAPAAAGHAAGDDDAAASGGTGLSSCPQHEAPQEELQQPLRGDSASCLHAWMQQTCGRAAGQGQAGPQPSTPAVAIPPRAAAAGALPASHSAAQLGGSLRQQQPLGGSSWDALRHSWGSSPQLAPAGSGPAPRPRKGAVLLDPLLRPRACSEFEAVLVLLGGHWPARGLLSGRYPPEGELDEPDPLLLPASGGGSSGAASDSGDGSLGGRSQSLGRLRRTGSARRRPGAHTPVVHCGSIRQAAQVVAMRELQRGAASGGGGDGTCWAPSSSSASEGEVEQLAEEQGEDVLEALLAGDLLGPESSGGGSGAAGGEPGARLDACRLAGAVAAAGVLLPRPLASGGEGGSPAALERSRSLLPCEDIGCLAAVTFRFVHQPEWLVQGARLIVRDRSTGRVAAAGYVAALQQPAAAPGTALDAR